MNRTRDTFENEAIIFLPNPQSQNSLRPYISSPDTKVDEMDKAAALWSFQHQKIIGHGTDTLPSSRARYFPLVTARGIIGVLALLEPGQTLELSLEQEHLMEAYADLAAVAIEGILLAQEARNIEVLKASEKLQTALLGSITHDLKTPLVSIIGVLSSIQEAKIKLDENAMNKLIKVARTEADRLNLLITNLLDESRLETGTFKIARQPAEVQDLVGAALEQLGQETASREIKINLADDLPFIAVDVTLMVQVQVNILDNAFKYSLSNSMVEIQGQTKDKVVVLEIADRGIGIPPQDLEHVFDKFYRVHRPEKITGTGLGLSIAKGIVEAHGGHIEAENRPGGGTIIRLSLPVADSADLK